MKNILSPCGQIFIAENSTRYVLTDGEIGLLGQPSDCNAGFVFIAAMTWQRSSKMTSP